MQNNLLPTSKWIGYGHDYEDERVFGSKRSARLCFTSRIYRMFSLSSTRIKTKIFAARLLNHKCKQSKSQVVILKANIYPPILHIHHHCYICYLNQLNKYVVIYTCGVSCRIIRIYLYVYLLLLLLQSSLCL